MINNSYIEEATAITLNHIGQVIISWIGDYYSNKGVSLEYTFFLAELATILLSKS